MASTIPAHVHVVAIALFSVAASFAQPTPAEIAKALAVYAPRPAYPYEGRSKHLTGSGIVLLNVALCRIIRDLGSGINKRESVASCERA